MNFVYLLIWTFKKKKQKKKITLDKGTQIDDSFISYISSFSFDKRKKKFLKEILLLENLIDGNIDIKKGLNYFNVTVTFIKEKEVSLNHKNLIDIRILVNYSLITDKMDLSFKFVKIKGISETEREYLENLQKNFSKIKNKDWSSFFEFYIRIFDKLNNKKTMTFLQIRNKDIELKEDYKKLNDDFKSLKDKDTLFIKNQRKSSIFSIEANGYKEYNEETKKLKKKKVEDCLKNSFQQKESFNFFKRSKDISFVFESTNNNFSRYKHDFEQIEMLGEGGFGAVYKVRNKLDGNFYAIKKVTIHYSENKETVRKILLEVKTLSKLYHPNIVRYYQAWVEEAEEGDISEDSSDSYEESYIENSNSNYLEDDHSKSKSNSEKFQELENTDYGQTFMISFEKNSSESNAKKKNHNKKPVILFIQMEYCEGETLKEFIPKTFIGNDIKIIKKLLLQIIDALAYIHSKGLIHHDLKPANIFLDKNNNVKLGDFGLVKVREGGTTENEIKKSFIKEKSVNGTPFYMSPEQKEGKNVDNKTDLYSLGIILLELITPKFNTQMERIKSIRGFIDNKLKNLPENIKEFKNEEIIELMMLLLKEDPSDRPSSIDLYDKFQDSLYAQLIISDLGEYKKMIDYVFSNKNKFVKMADFTFNGRISEVFKQVDFFKNFKIIKKTKEILEIVFHKFNCQELILPDIVPVRTNLDILIRTIHNKKAIKINYKLNNFFRIDKFKNRDLFIDHNANFILRKKGILFKFLEVLENSKIENGKFFTFSHHTDFEKFEVMFGNVYQEESGMNLSLFCEIETLKILNDLIEEFKSLLPELVCFISDSQLFDVLLNKIKVKKHDYSKFYNIIKNQRDNLIETINLELPYLSKKIMLIKSFLSIKETNFQIFCDKLRKLFPNDLILKQFIIEKQIFLEILKNITIKNLKIEYCTLPKFCQDFPIFHSGIIFWLCYVNPLQKKQKKPSNKYTCIARGGKLDNLLSTSNICYKKKMMLSCFILSLGKIFSNHLKFNHFLKTCKIKINKVLSMYNDCNSIFLASFSDPILNQKLNVANDLWNMGYKVGILFEEIYSVQKVVKKAMDKGFRFVIILKPGKIRVKVLHLGKKKEENWDYEELKVYLKGRLEDMDRVFANY